MSPLCHIAEDCNTYVIWNKFVQERDQTINRNVLPCVNEFYKIEEEKTLKMMRDRLCMISFLFIVLQDCNEEALCWPCIREQWARYHLYWAKHSNKWNLSQFLCHHRHRLEFWSINIWQQTCGLPSRYLISCGLSSYKYIVIEQIPKCLQKQLYMLTCFSAGPLFWN